MDRKEFKKKFGEIAKSIGFESAFGGWFKESVETIAVLALQKSNYGNYYDINVKLFVQGFFGKTYVRSKDLVKKEVGDIFTRQPNDYKDSLDLENILEPCERLSRLECLFTEYLVPFTEKAMTKEGIRELHEKEELFLLPAIKKELGIE